MQGTNNITEIYLHVQSSPCLSLMCKSISRVQKTLYSRPRTRSDILPSLSSLVPVFAFEDHAAAEPSKYVQQKQCI